jgi:hypothetical protein
MRSTRTAAFWLAPVLAAAVVAVALAAGSPAPESRASANPKPASGFYAAWKHSLPADPSYFPIAVWLQDPKMAPKYKAAGVNLYVGLWKGPTEEQLATLKAAGMPVICDQNDVGLRHKDDATIVGWMHGDEPDNAQELPGGKGYGPPVPPETIAADYERMRRADPTRPVMLNLGQGVAWDGWYGRGTRTNHPEDYPEYVKGGDIVSFDIYPVVHDKPEVQGKLEFVARGVSRLVQWGDRKKAVWNCIECTHIGSDRKPTPAQVRSEVWMSIIHGSQGLIWFVHEWKPKFNEHALLDDPEMLAAVTAINGEIRNLAPVIHRGPVAASFPDIPDEKVVARAAMAPVAFSLTRYDGAVYVFAVNMRAVSKPFEFSISVQPALIPAGGTAEVLGEGRTIAVRGGAFKDDFGPYAVHLYRIKQRT